MQSSLVMMISALLIVGVAGIVCMRFLGPRGFMDMPGGRRLHLSPVPRVGGIVLFISVPLWLQLTGNSISLSLLEWIAVTAMFAMGVIDDRFELRARWKGLMGLAIALALAWEHCGNAASGFPFLHLLNFNFPNSIYLRFFLLVLLFWGIPQSFNLIDGTNGLAIGYSAVIAFFLSIPGAVPALFPLLLIALLLLNWPKAQLFLGDAGSLTLGLFFAILATKTFQNHYLNGILWLFAYPILDVTMVVITRLALGNSIFIADRNHFHHHLRDWFGTAAWLKAPFLWLVAAGCASGSLLHGGWRWIPWCSLIVLLGLMVACIWKALKKKPADAEDARLRWKMPPATKGWPNPY